MEESESDSSSEDDYDEIQNNNKTEDVIRDEKEDQTQDSTPTAEKRRHGIVISMRATRESKLGSTRRQTQRLRSPFKSPMKECADLNLDNWAQDLVIYLLKHQIQESQKHSMELGTFKNPKIEIYGEKPSRKSLVIWSSRKYGQRDK